MDRIAELEDHLKNWERRSRTRTALLTLIPIGAALGIGYLAAERAKTTERQVDAALSALDVAPVAEDSSVEARLEAINRTGAAMQSLKREAERAGVLEDERDGLETRLAALEGEIGDLRAARAAAEGSIASLTAERDEAARAAADLEEQAVALRERIETLRQEGEAAAAQRGAATGQER